MTLEEHNNQLREMATRTGERLTERVVLVAATKMLATLQNRIFRDGKASDGSSIGVYSTRPYYASKSQFVKKSAFKPLGATGKKKFRSGAPHKSMYLKRGYDEFRDIQGRSTNEVNLQMRGDLKNSYVLQAKDNAVLMGINSELQSKKRKGLEKHFKNAENTIFPATNEEKTIYSEEVINELRVVEAEIIQTFAS